MTNLADDLWWLPEGLQLVSLRFGVAHTEALSDEDGIGELWQSFKSGEPSEDPKAYAIEDVAKWVEAWSNENVYRSLWVYDDSGRDKLLGPFYFDLDADDLNDAPDLEGALRATRHLVEILGIRGIGESDIRVSFTVHKGFNVEVRPEIVGVFDGTTWSRRHSEILKELRRIGLRDSQGYDLNFVSPTVRLDHIFHRLPPHGLSHSHVRLVGSKNVWLAPDGTKRWRLKRHVPLNALFSSSASDIAGSARK